MLNRLMRPRPNGMVDDSAPPQCSQCNSAMTESQRGPLMFAADFEQVTFHCAKCGGTETRSIRR